MRSKADVLVIFDSVEGVVGRHRLCRINVTAEKSDLALLYRVCDGIFIEHRAARHVYKHYAVLHHTKLFFTDHTACLLGKRHVNGDDIGFPYKRFEVDAFRIVDGGTFVDDDVTAQSACRRSDTATDTAVADDAPGLAAKLGVSIFCTLPAE